MLEIIFTVILILFTIFYLIPLAFSLLFAVVAILLKLWWVPFVLLVASIIFTLFIDFTMESFMANLPLIIGVAVSLVVQEILAARVK